MIATALSACLGLVLPATLIGEPPAAPMSEAQRTAIAAVDAAAPGLEQASLEVWKWAELALGEARSSALLADLAERAGMTVERGISGMPTAFLASAGSGRPVIAFLAEYDALPGLSQTVAGRREPRVDGEPGHGCGHNLFGAASLGAALAVKRAMEEHAMPGTVRLYGTPAEEHGLGKVFMVKDGLFDDVDVVLSWHPADKNQVSLQPSKALRSFEVTFHGRSAHASGAPWEGVSALDAVEAFTTGVNLLREHMPETARIHYVIVDGGGAPNVVPDHAKVWAFVRGKDWREQDKVFQHVRRIVEGADLMAWGEEHGSEAAGFRPAEIKVFTGLYEYNVNLAGLRAYQRNLERLGPPPFTEDDQTLARQIQKGFGVPEKGMSTEIVPLDPNRSGEFGGSTDVANISWTVPTIGMRVATWPEGVPAHSWASTAASGSKAAQRAMVVAAKVMATTGLDVLNDEALRREIRAEFDRSRVGFDYESPVGPDDVPSLPSHMVRH